MTTMRPGILAAMLIVAVAAPSVASAHPGHGDSGGVVHAFDHLIIALQNILGGIGAPLLGVVVVLAMTVLGGIVALRSRARQSSAPGSRSPG